MYRVDLLGRIRVVDPEGREADELLRQPKRLALLAFLALPAPGTWHRRETLLARFWPDADATRARTTLRNALYVIRQALGESVLRSRGAEEVSLDPAHVTCDVAAFLAAVREGRHAEAVRLYTGEFLPGLILSGGDGFDRWVEEQRGWLRRQAIEAAAALAEDRAGEGDLAGAITASRWLLAIAPAEEGAVRRLMDLLDRTGRRAEALAAYEDVRSHLRQEFDADPAPETIAAAERIRRRTEPGPAGVVASPVQERSRTGAPDPEPLAPVPARTPRAPHRRVAALLLLVGAVALAGLLVRRPEAPAPAPATRSVLVLPAENATGSTELDPLALAMASGVVDRMREASGVEVTSAIGAGWVLRPGRNPLAEAARLGATHVLGLRLERAGDSLRMVARLQDVASGASAMEEAVSFHRDRAEAAADRVVAGAVAAAAGRWVPRPPRPGRGPPVDPASWQAVLQGRYLLFTGRGPEARAAFERAVDLDPSNAAGWSGLSSIWASLAVTGRVAESRAWVRSEAAAERALALDSLQAPALANLGVIRAVRDGDTASGLAMIRRAIALAPSDAELRGAILQSVLRLDGRLDEALAEARIAGRLDPLVPLGMDREAFLLLCQGHAAEALARYRDVLSLDEGYSFSRRGAVRALAALGRWDEALAEWRILARGDSAVSRELEGARGEAGYWRVHQYLGLTRARLLEAISGGPPSLGRLGMAWLQAGEVDRGADLLEADARGGGVQVYHLRCHEATDGRREHPRVRKLLETYGHLGTVNRLHDPGRATP